jgi:hypothetical protein
VAAICPVCNAVVSFDAYLTGEGVVITHSVGGTEVTCGFAHAACLENASGTVCHCGRTLD